MLRPPPQLTVSEWAEHHRMLGSRASADPALDREIRRAKSQPAIRPWTWRQNGPAATTCC